MSDWARAIVMALHATYDHTTSGLAASNAQTAIDELAANDAAALIVLNAAVAAAAANVKTAKVTLSGTAIHAGVVAWQNPESTAIIIKRAIVDVTTVATAACTLDIGTTATNATTASDNLLDGIDVNAATGLLELADGDAPGAGNGKVSQKLAAGKWVTIKELSGSAAGLAGKLYLEYFVI